MSSSWESAHDWYDKAVGAQGHYYHQQIILPKVLSLLSLSAGPKPKLLDLGCGQGILARHLPSHVDYVGIDASPSLIKAARRYSRHRFMVGDVTQPLALKETDFTHVALILALQNIADPLSCLKNARRHLQKGGKLVIVLNHPCFRIPRQSSWQIDEQKKIQFRRIDRYFSPLKIPIQTHPSQKQDSQETFSFHYPLSTYTLWLKEAGFKIEEIQEWCSDKKSTGKKSTLENRSRKEFPLFLTLYTS